VTRGQVLAIENQNPEPNCHETDDSDFETFRRIVHFIDNLVDVWKHTTKLRARHRHHQECCVAKLPVYFPALTAVSPKVGERFVDGYTATRGGRTDMVDRRAD
jgi:hypothetical protein